MRPYDKRHLIYLLKCGKYLKIGTTCSPKAFDSRLTSLRIGCPYEIIPICVIDGTHLNIREKELHEMFDEHHHRGEWFKQATEIYTYFYEAFMRCYSMRRLRSEDYNIESKLYNRVLQPMEQPTNYQRLNKEYVTTEEELHKWIKYLNIIN